MTGSTPSALFTPLVAVMAPTPARWWLQSWLAAEGFQPDTRAMTCGEENLPSQEASPALLADGEVPRPIWHSTLLSYFPTAQETFEAVQPLLLHDALRDSPLWVQCGPMSTGEVLRAAELARRCGVAFCHAPFLTSPDRGRRPQCRLYDLERVPGEVFLEAPAGPDRVTSLVAAVTSEVTSCGALYFRPMDQHDLDPDRCRHGQPASRRVCCPQTDPAPGDGRAQ